jgi:hypothetical protein
MGAVYKYGRRLKLNRNEVKRGPGLEMGIPIFEIKETYQEIKSKVEEIEFKNKALKYPDGGIE